MFICKVHGLIKKSDLYNVSSPKRKYTGCKLCKNIKLQKYRRRHSSTLKIAYRNYDKKRRILLKDAYIIRLLKQCLDLSSQPPLIVNLLIELKRAQIQLQRLIREKQKMESQK